MSADREALVDAFVGGLRALLLASLAEDRRTPPAPDRRTPPAPDRSGRTLTVKDVAERYRTTVKSIYKRVNSGMLPALRLGRDYRFRDSDLAEYDRRCECNWTPPAEPAPPGQVVPIARAPRTAFERGRARL